MVAGLPALVSLRFCHELSPPAGGNRSPPACDLIGGAGNVLAEDRKPPPTRVSPWVEIIERGVELNRGAAPELYHAVAQRDYVAIVARTPDGKFPIVRQFRPALEKFAWEMPAGTVEPGEPPENHAAVSCLRKRGTRHGRYMRSAATRRAPRACRTPYIHSLWRPVHARGAEKKASRSSSSRRMNSLHSFFRGISRCNFMSARCCSRLCEGMSTLRRSGRPGLHRQIQLWNAKKFAWTNGLELF